MAIGTLNRGSIVFRLSHRRVWLKTPWSIDEECTPVRFTSRSSRARFVLLQTAIDSRWTCIPRGIAAEKRAFLVSREQRMNLTKYATDEDISLRASCDFFLLCPRDQKVAAGQDGSFSSVDRWTLNSSQVDFQGQGVQPGQIILLTKPTSIYRAPGEAFAVDSVGPGFVRLRRKGQLSGVGQPPAPPQAISNVEFSIVTFGPQIESASLDINRRFGIDDIYGARFSSTITNIDDLRDVVVLTVLARQYLDMSRELEANRDLFAAKAVAIQTELDNALAKLTVHFWSGPGLFGIETVSRFQTRLSR